MKLVDVALAISAVTLLFIGTPLAWSATANPEQNSSETESLSSSQLTDCVPKESSDRQQECDDDLLLKLIDSYEYSFVLPLSSGYLSAAGNKADLRVEEVSAQLDLLQREEQMLEHALSKLIPRVFLLSQAASRLESSSCQEISSCMAKKIYRQLVHDQALLLKASARLDLVQRSTEELQEQDRQIVEQQNYSRGRLGVTAANPGIFCPIEDSQLKTTCNSQGDPLVISDPVKGDFFQD